VRDITARKCAEEALRKSEARLRLAQVSAGAGMWDWDIGAGRLEWSEELYRLFGLDPKAPASFESWRSALHPEDKLFAENRIETAIQTRTPLTSEYRVVLPSGEVRWIHALGHTICDRGGRPERMSGICVGCMPRWRKPGNGLRRSLMATT
jgi:PAS domain S-box-containing protein